MQSHSPERLRSNIYNFSTKMQTIKVGSKIISKDSPVFIIAEAGVNHNGRLDLALKLIDAAAEAGADAVKFQTFKAEQVTTTQGKIAEYQKRNLGKTASQIAMIRQLEINENWYPQLIKCCKERGIIFMSTPHGHLASADFLKKFDMAVYKIASGDLTNRPLLEHIARFGKPMIISTGMANLKEVRGAIGWIKKASNNKIIILHCTTNYPCPPHEVNLAAMQTVKRAFPDTLIGYSDHTEGHQVSVMAVALGACVIEKHLTLDKNLPGPDHQASSDPQEFKATVKAIRVIATIMGSPIKKPNKSEARIMKIARKSVVTVAPVKKGEKFTMTNLTIKRPGDGIPPKYFKNILGKRAKRNIPNDILINKKDF